MENSLLESEASESTAPKRCSLCLKKYGIFLIAGIVLALILVFLLVYFLVLKKKDDVTIEWREVLNLPPVEDGDKPLRRLDTIAIGKGGEE